MPAPSTSKPNQLGAQQRAAILDKAFALFARQGYRRTSFGDIAEEVGLSRPAIYHYFKNKDAVFKAVTERIHKDIALAIDQALSAPGSIEDRLFAVFAARAGRDYALLFVSPYGHELLDERQKQNADGGTGSASKVRSALQQIVEEGNASGELELAPWNMTAEEAVTVLDHFFEGVLAREPSEAQAMTAARTMIDVFVAGLRKPHTASG